MATYYIKNTGNDSLSGLSDVNAWATIAKVNSSSFNAGDSILFKCGDVWRETLIVPSSGTVDAYITFSSYENGVKPKLYGSTKAVTWTSVSGNIWTSATSVTDPWAPAEAKRSEIFFTEINGSFKWGRVKKTYLGSNDFSNLTQEYDWTWTGNAVYVYAVTDPDTRYTAIEVPQREIAINLNQKEYIVFDGLEVAFAQAYGTYMGTYPEPDVHGLTIRNCKFHHFGQKGEMSNAQGISAIYSDMLIENNEISEAGRRCLCIYSYSNAGFSIENITIQNNILHDGYHTSGVDLALNGNCSIDNVVIRNNFIYDDPTRNLVLLEDSPSESIYIANNYAGALMSNIYIYNNVIKNTTMAGIHFYMSATGIPLDGLYIYNNTFYGFNPNATVDDFHLSFRGLVKNCKIKNNIFYGNANHLTNGSSYGIYVYSNTDITDIDADYNLYYQEDALIAIVSYFGANGNPWHMNDWVAMKDAIVGWEAHSPTPASPLFVSSSDYHLQPLSPARGAGINVGLTTDYAGNAYAATPSIGAYEYVPTTYYIKNGGNNTLDGLSDTNAWETLAKITAFQSATGFAEGDIISLKCGSTWRETLTVPRSGAVGNYMKFNSYSAGDKPKILGSTQAVTWTDQGGNIWSASSIDPYAGWDSEVFFNESGAITWGVKVASQVALSSEYEWFWSANVLYVYAASDPDSRYTYVEVPVRDNAVDLNEKNYLEFNGLGLFYLKFAGLFNSGYSANKIGFTLRNCEIGYLATPDGEGHGVSANYSDVLVEYNSIHDCGRRGLSLYNYTTVDVSNITVQYNNFYNGFHDCGTSIAAGSVGGATGDINNVIIRNNIMNDRENGPDWRAAQTGIFGATVSTGYVNGVKLYNNIFIYPNGMSFYATGKVEDLEIYNNTFYGFNKTATSNLFHIELVSDQVTHATNMSIKNNIFYNDAVWGVQSSVVSIYCVNEITLDDVQVDNNLYYSVDSRFNIVEYYRSGLSYQYDMSEFSTLNSPWNWDLNSPTPADPLFTSSSDYHLKDRSPAIGAGINVGLSTDYAGNLWSATPSIGAFEYTLSLTEGTWLVNRTTLNAMFDNLYQRVGI